MTRPLRPPFTTAEAEAKKMQELELDLERKASSAVDKILELVAVHQSPRHRQELAI